MRLRYYVLAAFLVSSLNWLSAQNSDEKVYKARITTTFGDMIIKLHNDTPIHRDNFIKSVNNGWYDGTLFHRVIAGFMMQGGDPNSIGATPEQHLGQDRCPTLEAEFRKHYFHKKGALAAARTPDGVNPEKRSSGCQFFIVDGYNHTDAQLTGMETEHFKFDDIARAYYKAVGGAAHLDMNYTIFGEVIEGLDIIDLICAMPTGKHSNSRPNTDITMKVEMID